ncbi:hypothetical protein GGH92_008269, partial [Coemansia sp. RSA 2673]
SALRLLHPAGAAHHPPGVAQAAAALAVHWLWRDRHGAQHRAEHSPRAGWSTRSCEKLLGI